MMTFTNSDQVPTIGTSRIGTIETTYDTLVKAFGEPTDTGASWLGKGDPPFYADYEEGDKVHLREGGEGRILKIVYIVMTDTECNEVEVMRATDLGNVIG